MDYKIITYDIECYPNYLLIGIKDTKGKYIQIDTLEQLNIILSYLDNLVFAGFNNSNYDSIILDYIIYYHNRISWNNIIKNAYKITDEIINKGLSRYIIRRKWNIPELTNQLDLSYYAYNMSLKELGIRMHHPILETLPIAPNLTLNREQIEIIKQYNINDLDITEKILKKIKGKAVEAKQNLIDSFQLPLNSYSHTDGVLAENILCTSNRKPIKKDLIRFNNTQHIEFNIPELQDLLETINNYWFDYDTNFSGELSLFNLNIKYGVGGLHACIDKYHGENVINIDVASYYPNIMKNNDLLPNTVQDKNLYYNMIDERIELKITNIVLANAYKTILNSIFGKLKYKFSKLFDIESFFNVTLNGQLLMLKLCEMLHEKGYKIVYINTDGLIIEDNGDTEYLTICEQWCNKFNYILEYDKIKVAWLRDVSNYILDMGDYTIRKGDFDISPDKKNNAYHRISWLAVQEYLLHGTSIEKTIKESKNIEDFVLYLKYSKIYPETFVENIDGSIDNFDGVIRFYWSKKHKNRVVAIKGDTGNEKVYQDGLNIGRLQNLNNFNDFDDIDYDRYINRAYEKLNAILMEPIENNIYIDNILKIGTLSTIPRKYLSAGIGKKRLNKPILSPDVTTINLNTGINTEFLVLDIDYPESENARRLLNYITKDNFIVYSSKYTIDDVFNSKCRYKIIYKYKGNVDIPKKRNNINIEVFYKHPVAIAGKRDDGYEYINNNGEIKEIDFNINDILEIEVPFNFLY